MENTQKRKTSTNGDANRGWESRPCLLKDEKSLDYKPENFSRLRILLSWSGSPNSRSCPRRKSVSKLRFPGASRATPSSESTTVIKRNQSTTLDDWSLLHELQKTVSNLGGMSSIKPEGKIVIYFHLIKLQLRQQSHTDDVTTVLRSINSSIEIINTI